MFQAYISRDVPIKYGQKYGTVAPKIRILEFPLKLLWMLRPQRNHHFGLVLYCITSFEIWCGRQHVSKRNWIYCLAKVPEFSKLPCLSFVYKMGAMWKLVYKPHECYIYTSYILHELNSSWLSVHQFGYLNHHGITIFFQHQNHHGIRMKSLVKHPWKAQRSSRLRVGGRAEFQPPPSCVKPCECPGGPEAVSWGWMIHDDDT